MNKLINFILKKRSFWFHFWLTLFTSGIWLFIYVISYVFNINFSKKQKIILDEEQKRQTILQKEKEEQYLKSKENEFQEVLNNTSIIVPTLSEEKIKRNPIKNFPEIKFSSITPKTIIDRVSDFVVIDLETTGLNAAQNEILEISAIRFLNFEPVEKISTLIKPNHEITQEIVDINGITNDMVASAPYIYNVIPAFVDFIGNANLVGHNLIFDLKFLYANGFDIFDTKRKYFDTLELSRKAYKGLFDYKLDTVAESCGIYIPNAHRAEHDSFATGLIFKEIVSDLTN